MRTFLALHQRGCEWLVLLLLRLAVAVDTHRTRLPLILKRWRGSLRRLYRDWLLRRHLAASPAFARRHRPWNRTPAWREEQVVRLHGEHPQLGAGQLRLLAARVLGFRAARETFRQILARRRDLVTALQDAKRRRPRKIAVSARNRLWGADLTLVWLLGFLPIWILGIVDYHGSRVLTFEPILPWPTGAAIARCLEAAIARHGAPNRLLTDRGPVFRAADVERVLVERGVRHVLTLPAHPWTNGRIERIFGTFKQTVGRLIWLFTSRSQIERFCRDFMLWHNRDRPHSSFEGRTPDEVYFGLPVQARPLGTISYFDGLMPWYRFG